MRHRGGGWRRKGIQKGEKGRKGLLIAALAGLSGFSGDRQRGGGVNRR